MVWGKSRDGIGGDPSGVRGFGPTFPRCTRGFEKTDESRDLCNRMLGIGNFQNGRRDSRPLQEAGLDGSMLIHGGSWEFLPMDALRTFFRHPHSAIMSDPPRCDFVPAEALPQPFRELLVHDCVRPVKHIFKVA
jgi:hypothetical protein